MIYSFFFFSQQKRAESPLDSTNPFLEEEQGEDVGTEKDADLTKVSLLELLRVVITSTQHLARRTGVYGLISSICFFLPYKSCMRLLLVFAERGSTLEKDP